MSKLLLALSVFMAGCIANPPSMQLASPQPLLVDMKDMKFVPNVIKLKVGQPLAITNKDAGFHNVRSLSKINKPFNLGFPVPNMTRIVNFQHPEKFILRCDVHPGMDATVEVVE